LFARSKDKLQFHYAVYLLNKNIAQLRWYCGLPTTDLRATLPNLATLINIKPNQMQYVYTAYSLLTHMYRVFDDYSHNIKTEIDTL